MTSDIVVWLVHARSLPGHPNTVFCPYFHLLTYLPTKVINRNKARLHRPQITILVTSYVRLTTFIQHTHSAPAYRAEWLPET